MHDGHAAQGCVEPAEAGWVPLDPDWLADPDARNQGAVGYGQAPSGICHLLRY